MNQMLIYHAGHTPCHSPAPFLSPECQPIAIFPRFLPVRDSSLWTHFFHMALVRPTYFRTYSNVTFFTLQSLTHHIVHFMHVNVFVGVIVNCLINMIFLLSVPTTKAETISIFSLESSGIFKLVGIQCMYVTFVEYFRRL